MAVSFVSKVLNSSDYIQPIDQNLVYGALLHKQQSFDKGVQQVDSLLDNLSQQPIYNAEHKKYYEQKVAELTESVNKLGGADFSERGTLQQIGNLSALVSKDQRILGAVQDGKKIQKAQAQMELWKSDPKKYAGYYAPQNEWDLANSINTYANSTDEKASFSGAATPYVNHRKIIGDKILSIQKQIAATGGYQSLSGDGKYIQTGMSLSPQRIQQIVQAELSADPSLMNQIRIDGNYGARGITDDNMLRSAQLSQLTAAKAQAQRLGEQYRKSGAELLKTKTGTPAEQAEAQKQYQDQLAHFKETLDQYDGAIRALPSKSREELVRTQHLQDYMSGMQSEYAFESKKIAANPIYGVELAHKDRQEALAQRWKEFNIGEKNENDRFLWGHLKQDEQFNKEFDQRERFKLMDIQAKTSLQQNKDGSYSTPDADFKTVDSGVSTVTTPSFEAMQQTASTDAAAQNGRVLDLVVGVIGNGDQSLIPGLRAQLAAGVDPSGNINQIKYPKAVAPAVAEAAQLVINDYQNMLQGKPHDPKLVAQLKPEQRALLQQIEIGVKHTSLQQEQLKNLQKIAGTRAGMTPAELNEMSALQALKAKNSASFVTGVAVPGGGGIAQVGTPQANRLAELEAKYAPAREQVATELSKSGVYNKSWLVVGKSAEKDSDLSRIVQHRIAQQAISPQGATNAQLQQVQALMEAGIPSQMVVHKDTQQIEVKVAGKNAEGKQVTGSALIDFANTSDWNAVLSDQLRSTPDNVASTLQSELDKTGALISHKKPMSFAPIKSELQFGVSPVKTSTGYGLGLLYQGKQIPIPQYTKQGHALIPESYMKNPMQYLASGGLDQWSVQLQQVLKSQYGKDNPSYKPTVNDLYKFITDPRFF